MNKFIAILYSLLLTCACVTAVEPNEETILPEGRTWIKTTTETWRKEATADQKIFPGIRADKKARRVEIAAVGTGTAEAGVLEFAVVSENGRAYEALTVTTALPSNVVEALDFIGMPRGRAVNFGKHQFWPKGERINVSLVPVTDNKRGEPIKLGDLIKTSNKNHKNAVGSFVYVGSETIGPNDQIIVDDTGTIASLFSDPFTVLDVPEQTPQGEHYGSLTAAGNKALERTGRLVVVLEPEYPANKRRVKDLALAVLPGAETGELLFNFSEAGAEKSPAKIELPMVLENLQTLIKSGHDPYIRIEFAPDIDLKLASDFARMIDTVSAQGLVRIEAVAGSPYYQALMPDPRWRDRKSRPAQPVELHLEATAAGWKGKVVRPKFKRTENGWDVDLNEESFETEDALHKLLADDEGGDALFYYLPETTSYGPLLALYKKFYKRWPIQYVLLNAAD